MAVPYDATADHVWHGRVVIYVWQPCDITTTSVSESGARTSEALNFHPAFRHPKHRVVPRCEQVVPCYVAGAGLPASLASQHTRLYRLTWDAFACY